MENESEPLRYAIRIGARAERDSALAISYFLDGENQESSEEKARVAREWQEGLFVDLARLTKNPRRFPAWAEGYFHGDVRQKIYRRTAASVAYRLLLLVEDATLDGPRVTLLHVRHGAARPLSRAEARAIETQNESS